MAAWHNGTLKDLLTSDPEQPVRILTTISAERGLAATRESVSSWRKTVTALVALARHLSTVRPESLAWHYFLEFEIPMRGRRIDASIIADNVIFLIECKTGVEPFSSAARWQAEQYALDMRDFHAPSQGQQIVPVLVSFEMPHALPMNLAATRSVQDVICLNEASFPAGIEAAWNALHRPDKQPIDPHRWEIGEYRPTPNIIQAAQSLYGEHSVRDIALAGSTNLSQTVSAVLQFIQRCRTEHRRGIAFITGAPGAGKTLAGLEIAHAADVIGEDEGLGLFLSGNWPLVEVISAAIAESAAAQGHRPQRHATREVGTLIGHAYRFRNEYAEHPERVPHHRVLLFDEAQRAWDGAQVAKKTHQPSSPSEPELMLRIMSRTPDWAVLVAMVGSGQEINTGESGLREWAHALLESPDDWLVLASPHVFRSNTAQPDATLFDEIPANHPTVTTSTDLDLKMNVRSPRAEHLNQWVDHLLRLDANAARAALPDLREFPMALTRSLDTARAWLREHADAADRQRMGLLASAGARRLRAWGLEAKTLQQEQTWAHWFLRERGDVRSSNQLEVPATNFDCQGLEIDWAGVCWGNDFVPETSNGDWKMRRFVGGRWQAVRTDRHFVVNAYRVILTRARRGQIIWVPRPDGTDATLAPADFDAIAELLIASGVPSID